MIGGEMQKIIIPKGEMKKAVEVEKVIAEKTGDISIAVLTDLDYAKNNGYQKEIEGIDMEANNVIIVKP